MPRATPRWEWWLLAVLAGCATTAPLPQRLDALEAEGGDCERFSTFDATARELQDELLTSAPGELLVPGSSRLNAARRACARHTLQGLLSLREREGLDAVQLELDALARAFPVDRLDALVADTPGLDAASVGPLLAEARERVSREAQAPGAARKAQLDTSGTECAAVRSCEAAHCLSELARAGSEKAPLTPQLRAEARRCLDEGAARPAEERARRVSTLLTDLRAFSSLPEEVEATLALETLRRTVWPEVEAAATRGHPARAAQLAAPFDALDSARPMVAATKQRAVSAHLDAARTCGGRALCARLHRRVAASVGGQAEPPLAPEAGRWERGRWACHRPPLELPEPPPAMTLRLDAVCQKPPPRKAEPNEVRTFELEEEMMGNALVGEVRATCAGQSSRVSFRVAGFQDSTEEHPPQDDGEVARQDLSRLLPKLAAECRRRHAQAAVEACHSLAGSATADTEQRFAEAAVVTGQWAPCFAEWFTRRYGVAPPAPAPPAALSVEKPSEGGLLLTP